MDFSTKYSNYNKHTWQYGATNATINNQKNKYWFHFIWDFLLPLIEARDALLYDNVTLGNPNKNSSDTNLQLSDSQLAVYNSIPLAKAAWYTHQSEKIKSMWFNPKEVWKSVHVIYVGYTSHHALPTIIQMCLPNG